MSQIAPALRIRKGLRQGYMMKLKGVGLRVEGTTAQGQAQPACQGQVCHPATANRAEELYLTAGECVVERLKHSSTGTEKASISQGQMCHLATAAGTEEL